MRARQIPSTTRRSAILDDASKGPGLLFGTLLILAVFGLVESVVMFWSGRPASLVELLIFALLAADAIILILATHQSEDRDLGWLRLLSVWVLGLLPYFVWVVIYAGGKGVAGWIQRHGRRQLLIAALIWVGMLILCSSAYWFASSATLSAAVTH